MCFMPKMYRKIISSSLNKPNKEQNAAIIILFSFYEFKTPNKMSIEFAMEFMKPGIA